jgi:CHAD domain-containing protein
LDVVSFEQRALVALRRVFAGYLGAIDANWHAGDADALHDLRVAIRRTRALLANAKGVIDEPTRTRFADGFGTLARATTAARDLDVLVADWPQIAALVPDSDAGDVAGIHEALCRRQAAARAEVAATLASDASAALITEWRVWLTASPDFAARHAEQRITKVVRRRAHKSRRRLTRLARLDTPDARHAWRKEAKRLRYLAEAFPQSFRRKLAPALAKAQDAVGRERDRYVQAGIIEALGGSALADALRRQPAASDPRRKVARSLKRWIRAA